MRLSVCICDKTKAPKQPTIPSTTDAQVDKAAAVAPASRTIKITNSIKAWQVVGYPEEIKNGFVGSTRPGRKRHRSWWTEQQWAQGGYGKRCGSLPTNDWSILWPIGHANSHLIWDLILVRSISLNRVCEPNPFQKVFRVKSWCHRKLDVVSFQLSNLRHPYKTGFPMLPSPSDHITWIDSLRGLWSCLSIFGFWFALNFRVWFLWRFDF